ncbi:MAG: translesion DNA synthesis-associated protein ImuA [Bryobacteraceae bacterium]|nr:translesion DNA synthesis-associated protein ImuA [Bryobacteraceae bacterium]
MESPIHADSILREGARARERVLVLQHPAVWRGGELARVASPSVPSGFPELDAQLPGGGWPAGALTEIHSDGPGMGELQLTMPAAARLAQSGRWLVLVAPPHLPYAPALAARGVRLARLLLVRAASAEENLWAFEQALRARGCGAVLGWGDFAPERALRRLQLAAESTGALAFLFRFARAIPASPAALRLHVGRSGGRKVVRILKRRGGGVPAPIVLDPTGVLEAPGTAAGDAWRMQGRREESASCAPAGAFSASPALS